MKINKIDLYNIGPYYGKNVIEFDGSNSNITIFGGKNGSGKTTLFNLIKISIYGYRSLGYITQNKSYNEIIKKMINNSAIKQKLSASSSIEIEYVKNFKNNKVEISRVWDYPSYNESNELKLNGEKLSNLKKYQIIDEINELFPSKLLKINLFDGEAINGLTQQSEFYDFIESIIFSYFNLNIIDSLEKDFQKYLKISNDQDLSIEDAKLKSLILENNAKKNYRSQLLTKLEIISIETTKFKNMLNDLNVKILESEAISKAHYNSTLELIKNINKNFKKKLASHLEIVSEEIVLSLFYNDFNLIIENYKRKIDEILMFQKKNLFSDSFIQHEDFIFNLDISKIYEISNHINLYKDDKINKSFESLQNIAKEKIVVNNTLKKNINQEFYDSLKDLENQIEHLESERLVIEDFISSTDEILKNNEVRIKDLKKTAIMKSRSVNSVQKIYDYLKLFEDFVNNEMSLLTKKVSLKSSEIISKIKSFNYFGIIVDNVSRKIQLDNGDFIGIEKLSAGERQMVLLVLLKSIIEISGKKYPIIFDTPIARLDLSNKKEFVKLMTDFDTNQIIVFSTDREFDNNILDFKRLKNSNFYSIINTGGVSKILANRYFEDLK